MSLAHSSSIVRDSLVLYLDAANPKSYPGTGSSWNDLSGNNNSFTLFNSPTYSSGFFNFNGTTQYARSTNTLNLSPYNSITIEIGFACNTSVSPMGMLFEHSSDWNSNAMGFGLLPNSSGSTAYVNDSNHTNQSSGSGAFNYTGINGTTPVIHTNIFTRIVDPTGRNAYVNSIEQSVITGSKTTAAYSTFRNDNMFLGARNGNSAFSNCKIYYLLVYGKKLSQAEINQNFNARRGRYGL